ncbi:MAG TPA: diguanylate cyclase [Acidimicrobiales bacterium]|nr:diguanylate cyclase [Acidimicrobiales bacterium]
MERPNATVNDIMGGVSGDGGAYIGTGSLEALARSFLREGQEAYVALRGDGVIVYASGSLQAVVGLDPQEVIGTNAFDWIHPEDAERAFVQLTELTTVGSTPGIGGFRVRLADGRLVPVEAMGNLVHDGSEELLGIWLRDASHQVYLEQMLHELVRGTSREDLLQSVCDTIDWRQFESMVGIAWGEDDNLTQVSTGLPAVLGGADIGQAQLGSPWVLARGDCQARQGVIADLDDLRRQAAAEAGLGAYWVEPVKWDAARPPATITVWTAAGPRAPGIHAWGVGVARWLVELVLVWTEQTKQLDEAARSDSLTGLLNHKAFFAALAASTAPGAILYLDLDRFKPVNDDLGHAAGDALLRIVAGRLRGCIRHGDVAGRLGGDEFAVVCAGLDEAGAVEVAHRILESVATPARVLEDGNVVRVEASIGVAVSSSPMSEDLLRVADGALSAAKAAGRGRVHVVVTAGNSPATD